MQSELLAYVSTAWEAHCRPSRMLGGNSLNRRSENESSSSIEYRWQPCWPLRRYCRSCLYRDTATLKARTDGKTAVTIGEVPGTRGKPAETTPAIPRRPAKTATTAAGSAGGTSATSSRTLAAKRGTSSARTRPRYRVRWLRGRRALDRYFFRTCFTCSGTFWTTVVRPIQRRRGTQMIRRTPCIDTSSGRARPLGVARDLMELIVIGAGRAA